MRENRTSGLMSEEGKRSALQRATAPFLDSTAIFKGHFELIHPVSLHPFHWRRVVIVRILVRIQTDRSCKRIALASVRAYGAAPLVRTGPSPPGVTAREAYIE